MTSYTRPEIHFPAPRDAAGDVIDYGNRWGGRNPPGDAYSVDTHPERFLPLHTVADALLTHLQDNFMVDVLEDLSTARDLSWQPDDVIRAVRVIPRLSSAAPLTFVCTSYPSVVIHAGALTDALYPTCGCDACDDSWDMVADLMEEFVLAVLDGRFWERIGPGVKPWDEYGIRTSGGELGNRSEDSQSSPERIRRAQEVLQELPRGWVAWPLNNQKDP